MLRPSQLSKMTIYILLLYCVVVIVYILSQFYMIYLTITPNTIPGPCINRPATCLYYGASLESRESNIIIIDEK